MPLIVARNQPELRLSVQFQGEAINVNLLIFTRCDYERTFPTTDLTRSALPVLRSPESAQDEAERTSGRYLDVCGSAMPVVNTFFFIHWGRAGTNGA